MNALKAPEILDLYRHAGDAQYAGEAVTQLQHAWQCGQLARLAGAPLELQLASWLHDLGHLIMGLPGTPTLRGEDDRHEAVAAPVLQALWGERVADPVRLHVQAKRYLVGRHPHYKQSLSEDSLRSLRLQGGAMDTYEQHLFEQLAFHRDALKLRTWDDEGKRQGWFAPSPEAALSELGGLMTQVSDRRIR
jgi:predicted HD phosphohydrolase